MKASGLDALLGRWPAVEPQEKGGASWDERADAIVAAAVARKDQATSDVIDKLVAPPALDAEPGEEKAQSFQFPETEKRETAGATQPMSDQGKKPSLKELAARASQAGAARGSIPPGARASTPPPSAVGPASLSGVPRISSIPGTGATVTPITRSASPAASASTPPVSARPRSSRASDPGREDSGILRLADIQAEEAAKAEAAAAAAEAAVAAAKQQSEKPAATRSPTLAAVPAPSSSGGRTGMWAGVAIAVMGVAAAFAMYRTRQPAETVPSKPETVAAAPQTAKPEAPVPAETAKPATQDEPAAVASSDAAPAQSGAPRAADPAQGSAGTVAATATAVAEVKPSTATTADPKGSKVGTLDEEMKKAVGSNESQPAPQDDSKPAAGGGGALPDVPSQGNAQAAVRAALPSARACVAGATETSSASVTFSSSGSVSSVSVSGWAAQNGKTGCVQSALRAAHVAPFAKPTFTVPVTIRP